MQLEEGIDFVFSELIKETQDFTEYFSRLQSKHFEFIGDKAAAWVGRGGAAGVQLLLTQSGICCC